MRLLTRHDTTLTMQLRAVTVTTLVMIAFTDRVSDRYPRSNARD